jgi:putative endonuclease
MFYVYVIESQKTLDLYKGFTVDVNKRLKEHNKGVTKSTKNGIPWKLIYCEVFKNKQDAIEREKYLKSGWGRKYLEKVLKNYFKRKK